MRRAVTIVALVFAVLLLSPIAATAQRDTDPGSNATPTTAMQALPRTGVRSTTLPLALIGITSIALGSLLLVASSRRKAPS